PVSGGPHRASAPCGDAADERLRHLRLSFRGEPPCDLAPVRRAIRAATKPYGLPADARITVAFVTDDEMRALNARYRKKDRTTEVLSFGQAVGRAKGEQAVKKLRRDADGELDVGDIVISPAQAGRQARRRKTPPGRETAFLAAT